MLISSDRERDPQYQSLRPTPMAISISSVSTAETQSGSRAKNAALGLSRTTQGQFLNREGRYFLNVR